MKTIASTLIFLFIAFASFAQKANLTSLLCGKTWYPEKYKETDGKIYPLEAEYQAQYVRFNCDGTYESLEDGGVVLKGAWKYDAASKKITATQSQSKAFPAVNTTIVVSCTPTEFAIKKKDGGGEWITFYLKAK
jgi:hypothetical protein